MRINEDTIGLILLKTEGDLDRVVAVDRTLESLGNDWFVGCLNAVEPRSLQVPLAFLPAGKFEAQIYRDDAAVATRTKVGIERRDVDSRTVLTAALSGRGGMAVRIVPKRVATKRSDPGASAR